MIRELEASNKVGGRAKVSDITYLRFRIAISFAALRPKASDLDLAGSGQQDVPGCQSLVHDLRTRTRPPVVG